MNWQTVLLYALALLVGGLGGIHVPINGAIGARINSALVATFTFYGIAFLLISLLVVLTWNPQAFIALGSVPRWYFLAGIISVVVVGGSTYLIPRIGAVNMFVLVLVAQMMVRLVISHYGWLESPVSPITPYKMVGAALLLLGTILVVRY